MLDKFVSWQNKRHTRKQKTLLALSISTVFIFIFIPAIPFFSSEKLDKNLNLPKILATPFDIYIGAPLAILGLILFTWTIILFLKVGEGTQIPLIPTQKLVTVGPFAYSRNPMVLGVIIWIMGLGILFNSYSFIGLGLLIPFLYLVYIKLVEEKELEARFGKEYLEYKEKMPFLIPYFGKKI